MTVRLIEAVLSIPLALGLMHAARDLVREAAAAASTDKEHDR